MHFGAGVRADRESGFPMISLRRRRLLLMLASGAGMMPAARAGVSASPPIRADRASFLSLARTGSAIVGAGERGLIARSVDEGLSWPVMRLPTARTLTTVLGHPDGLSVAAGHGGVMFRSVDAGARWRAIDESVINRINPEREPILCGLIRPNGAVWLGGAFGTVLHSADRGATWERVAPLGADLDRHVYGLFDTPDGRSGWLVGESGTLARRAADGSWASIDSPYEGSFFGGLMTAAGVPLVFGMRGAIYRGNETGSAWLQCPCPQPVAWMSGRVLRDRRIVLVGDQGWIAVSDDDGRSIRLQRVADTSLADLIEHPGGAITLAGVQGLSRRDARFAKGGTP